jgi:hypothetical protein
MMQMKKVTSLILIAATFGLGTGYSYADNRSGAVTVTPGVGLYSFSRKRSLHDAALPNLAVGYTFSKHWGIEASFGTFNTGFSPANVPGSARARLYLVDGLYHFEPYKMFSPFVSFGTGILYLNTVANKAISASANSANINVGLGAQLFSNQSIALKAEVKDIYTIAGAKNDFMFNFGVSFLFGGNKDTEVMRILKTKEVRNYKDE